jgi:hypothetical protein
MHFSSVIATAALALLLAAVGAVPTAEAGNVLAEISVRGTKRPSALHGEMFLFPENVRDYSASSFYGWSFRQELGNDRVRVLEVARVRSPGAYLMATDLFADGHYSTMSHTVVMVFPRDSTEPYALREDVSGVLNLTAPNGSVLRIDGHSGALLKSDDFWLSPQGVPGTPPGLHHRGLRLEITAVGKNPFLRHTPARFIDGSGTACETTTDDLFRFVGSKPESDVFRFDSDAELFAYLSNRCPRIVIPDRSSRLVSAPGVPVLPGRTNARPETAPVVAAKASARSGGFAGGWSGFVDFLSSILSNR